MKGDEQSESHASRSVHTTRYVASPFPLLIAIPAQEFEFEVSRPCSNFICKVVRVLVPQQPAHPAKGSSTRSLHAAGSHASLAPDTPAGRGTARQRVPSAASGRESEITVPLAEAQVPLATLEACKARKRWLSLQSICAQTTGSSGADQNAAAANPEAANAPSTSKAHVAGADAAGVEGGTETATAYGDAEQQAVVAGERESSARMQMKMQYQYSETYMAHSMPDVAIDFRICILGRPRMCVRFGVCGDGACVLVLPLTLALLAISVNTPLCPPLLLLARRGGGGRTQGVGMLFESGALACLADRGVHAQPAQGTGGGCGGGGMYEPGFGCNARVPSARYLLSRRPARQSGTCLLRAHAHVHVHACMCVCMCVFERFFMGR